MTPNQYCLITISIVCSFFSKQGISGCQPEHTHVQTVHKGTLTVGYTPNYPPASFTDNNSVTGIDNDIVRKIAAMECLNVRWIQVSPASGITGIQHGRYDLGTGTWYRSKPRLKVVNMTVPIYVDQMAVISRNGVKDIRKLKGHKVGTVNGFLWNSSLQQLLGQNNVSIYPASVNMMQDLKNGRITAALNGFGPAVYSVKKMGDAELEVKSAKSIPQIASTKHPAQVGYPVYRSDSGLLNALNEDIKKLRSEGWIKNLVVQKYNLPASVVSIEQGKVVE